MKNLAVLIVMLVSLAASAQTKMGTEAVEMFQVLSHQQVVECLRDLDSKLINVEVKKIVARCPGCNTYIITGKKLDMDVPRKETTSITIAGRGVFSMGQFVQTYKCEVKN